MKRFFLQSLLVSAMIASFVPSAFAEKKNETKENVKAQAIIQPVTYYITLTQTYTNSAPNGRSSINISDAMIAASGMSDRMASKIRTMRFNDLMDGASFLSYAGWKLEQCYTIPSGMKSQVVWVFTKSVTDTSELLKGFPNK